jgi:succinyl-CoA synthetase beta subunit
MRLYEFEAKKLFRRYKIPVLEGVIIDRNSLNELEKVTYPVVVKAQTFLGGRGKAGFIQFASDKKEANKAICSILGKSHGPFVIEKVLVEKRIDIEKEVYIAATIDRLEHKPLFMLSKRGGMEIEAITKHGPGELLKYYFNPGEKMPGFKARMMAADLGFTGNGLGLVAGIIFETYRLFQGFDCKLVEINPLALGKREQTAKAAGIPYVDLDGNIGVFPGGAGFGIAAIDLITHYQGKPANFMDSGGAPTQEKLRAMLGLLIDNPKVKTIFGARFGGISRCDDWAKALVQYVKENKPKKPMIMRMAGNMEKQGRKILEQAKRDYPELFKDIKIYAVDTPIEDVIKETIRIEKELDTE